MKKRISALVDVTVLALASLVAGARAETPPEDVIAPITRLINLTMALAKPVFMLAVVVAGVYWITARDNPEKRHLAKVALESAIFGAFIVLVAGPMSNYLFGGV